MAPRIITTGSTWVEPAGPVVPRVIQMSATENQCAQVYPTAIWFFPTTKDSRPPMEQYALLKRSMARMLYQQPIVGGTLLQDDRGAYSVEIPPAPRAGARFHYRDLSHDASFPTFKEFAQAGYPIIDTKHDGLSVFTPEDFPCSAAGDPTFLSQMTVLRGGFTLTGSWTHLIGDLIQPRISATCWAEQTKLLIDAELAGSPEPALPKPVPEALIDRSRLLPHVPHLLSFEEVKEACDRRGQMFLFDPTDPETTARLMQGVFPPAHLKPAEMQNEDELRIENGGMMHFPLKTLQRLQALAQAHSSTKLSAVNIIIGLLWQRFYIAKYDLAGKSATASQEIVDRLTQPAIVFPGDVRGRLNPPLPQAYLGAAVDMFKASTTAQELVPKDSSESALGKSLGAAALAVRQASDVWDEESYMELLRLFMSTPVSVPFLPKGPLEFLVTDHTRNAPMRLSDWGHGIGAASGYRQPYMGRDLPQGEVTIMPRLANGDIQVMITAERVTLERMFNDSLLTQFALPMYMGYNFPQAVAAKRAAAYTPTARL